jgi:hypothetical protein
MNHREGIPRKRRQDIFGTEYLGLLPGRARKELGRDEVH